MIPAIYFGKSVLHQFLTHYFEDSSFLTRHLISSSQLFLQPKTQVKLLIFYIGQAAKWFMMPSNSRRSGLLFKKSHAFTPLYLLLKSSFFLPLPQNYLCVCVSLPAICVLACYFQVTQKSFFSYVLLLCSFSPPTSNTGVM